MPTKSENAEIYAPLSPWQRQLWLSYELDSGHTGYHMQQHYHLEGQLNPAALKQALEAVIARHAILRTRFRRHDGQPAQFVQKTGTAALRMVGFENTTESRLSLEELVEIERSAPFDLAIASIRTLLVRLAPEQHALVITMHHLVCDRASINILNRELSAFYNYLASGKPLVLDPLPIQYAEFAAAQDAAIQAGTLEKKRKYWISRLHDAPILVLPTDSARTGTEDSGGTVTLLLEPKLTDDIRALGRRCKATTFMTITAAFSLVLGRLANQDDVVIGAPAANRANRALSGAIGFFLNTVALRCDLSGNPSFEQLVDRIRQTCTAALTNQDWPFDRVLEDLATERGGGRQSLLDVMINYDESQSDDLMLDGLQAKAMPPQQIEPKFALALYVRELQGEMCFYLVHRRNLFTSDRMSELLGQLREVLIQAVVDAKRNVEQFSLITPDFRRRMHDPHLSLNEPEFTPVHSLFAKIARATPDLVAIQQGADQWSYLELSNAAASVARMLLEAGHQRGQVIGITGRRCFSLIAAAMGVLKVGGVLLLIDENLPRARRQFMVTNSRAQIVLTVDSSTEVAEGTTARVIPINVASDGRSRSTNEHDSVTHEDPDVGNHGSEPAYIFYTSGTTGHPKGVLGCHKGLSHFLDWERRALRVNPTDRCSQLTALSFDPVLRDMFLPLTSGATLCLPSADHLSAEESLSWLESQRITILHAVPSLVQRWLTASPTAVTLSHLRCVLFAGEPLSSGLVRLWRSSSANSQIINLYGPTETTLAKFFYVIQNDEVDVGIQPVGQPLPHTQPVLMTPRGVLCGAGEPGEIYIRTPFRSLGYLNEQETRDRFQPNPFRCDRNDLLYRTGDLGRYLPNGILQILGRTDRQIKILGVRVEPEEIAGALHAHPAVAGCTVQAVEDGNGEKLLAAYVQRQSPVNRDALRSFLRESLPSAMIPRAIKFLDRLPLSANGKVDLKALPRICQDDLSNDSPYVAPATPFQNRLAAIWETVLGKQKVGIYDNFFDLGGHSLNAAQVISRVRDEIKVELSLRSVFDNPTIVSLEKAVHCSPDARHPREEQQPIELAVRSREKGLSRSYPLSFPQESMWLLQQLAGGSDAYWISKLVTMRGALSIEALRRAFAALVERHEVLRHQFVETSKGLVQRVTHSCEPDLSVIDLSGVLSGNAEGEVRRLATEIIARPVDFSAERCYRVVLFRVSSSQHYCLLSIHHIACDGWSMGVLTRDLSVLYNAFISGAEPDLCPLPMSYGEIAEHQRKRNVDGAVDLRVSYWKETLAGLNPIAFAARGSNTQTDSSVVMARTSIAFAQRFRAMAAEQRCTTFTLMLTAFEVLLYQYTGRRTFAIGCPVANRTTPSWESMVGLFMNVLAVRADVDPSKPFLTLWRELRETVISAHAYQDFPLEKIIAEINPSRAGARNPVFNVLFAFHNQPRPPIQMRDLNCELLDFQARANKLDLELAIIEDGPNINLQMQGNSRIFAVGEIERMMGRYIRLLGEIAEEPEKVVGDLQLLAPGEVGAMLRGPEIEYPQLSPAQRIGEQADRSPEAIAVQDSQRQLSYGELNGRANQLARYLAEQGVRCESRVAVALERTVDCVVALLAVQKAGGTYVPLDPSYPLERLALVLSDARAELLLTDDAWGDRRIGSGTRILHLGQLESELQKHSRANFESLPWRAEQLVYLIYTSGSTGRPKGVGIPHAALANFLESMRRRPGCEGSDVLVAVTTLSFDIAALELYLPLITGGRVVLARREEALDGEQLLELLQASAATMMQATPAGWRVLLESEWKPPAGFKALCGGEALGADLAQSLIARGVELVNLYGPTETAVWSSCQEVEPADSIDDIKVRLGQPIANTGLFVLDEQMRAVPIGMSGELYIGGRGLARGYWGKPAKTAEQFVPHPYGRTVGERLYRTGDWVRYGEDGELEYLGRRDQQVKIRGYRIELGEIEAALVAQREVRQSIVVAQQQHSGQTRLIAYVVLEKSDVTARDLRLRLHTLLPGYMVPAAFVFLPALPLTPNGKIDRAHLPLPDDQDLTQAGSHVAPTTETESQLARIWAEVLNIPNPGVHDNFFELGGSSLLMLKLRAGIRGSMSLEIPLIHLFEYPTIRSLAEHLSNGAGARSEISAARRRATTRQRYLAVRFGESGRPS